MPVLFLMPQFTSGIGEARSGAIMVRIIYSLLLLVISICSMASVVWLLSFIGFDLLLLAGACFIAFASVTLAEVGVAIDSCCRLLLRTSLGIAGRLSNELAT